MKPSLSCDGKVYKSGEVISITEQDDDCLTVQTSVCKKLPGLETATIESDFKYKNCCNDDEGLSHLNISKLEPETCSERTCNYSKSWPFAIWMSTQVKIKNDLICLYS